MIIAIAGCPSIHSMLIVAGIYFHIPFCKQACHYCNFHFSTSLGQKKEMLEAMVKEIKLTAKRPAPIETIYFGGGTPSILDTGEILSLLNEVNDNYKVSVDAEITLEANPDDINESKLKEWKEAGINRFSIGIQSFSDNDLAWMNRVHSAQQAVSCIHMVKDAGFNNFSIDLIYGTPGLSNDVLKKNIDTVIGMDVPHISCYALTVELRTALHKMIALKKKEDVDPDIQAAQFLLLIDRLTAAGYEHYEISNFAKPGFRSRHNSNYWQGIPYTGIGPSAHSFNGDVRKWNINNNAQYIRSIMHGIIPREEERLTEVQKLNEYIMTSLRTMEGMDLVKIEQGSGRHITEKLKRAAAKYLDNNLLKYDEGGSKLILTNEGKLLADGIAADLFFTELTAFSS